MLENNKIYVDKTQIIYELIKAADQGALIVHGSRRTGKTLLIETIRVMYTEHLDWWKINGPDIWLTKNQPNFFKQNPFPIITFKFSHCSNDSQFKRRIVRFLNQREQKTYS